jgi:hypothetical protein
MARDVWPAAIPGRSPTRSTSPSQTPRRTSPACSRRSSRSSVSRAVPRARPGLRRGRLAHRVARQSGARSPRPSARRVPQLPEGRPDRGGRSSGRGGAAPTGGPTLARTRFAHPPECPVPQAGCITPAGESGARHRVGEDRRPAPVRVHAERPSGSPDAPFGRLLSRRHGWGRTVAAPRVTARGVRLTPPPSPPVSRRPQGVPTPPRPRPR